MPVTLKMWIGNLDGRREGLVVAPTKVRAREVIGASTGARSSRKDFDDYWTEHPVDPRYDPEVLYTRRFGAPMESWSRGRCP